VIAPINPLGLGHLVFFGLFIPWAAWRSKVRFEASAMPSFRAHALQTILNLMAFGAFSLFVAFMEGITLLPAAMPPWRAIGAGVVILILMVAIMRPRWRRAVEKRARIVQFFMPKDGSERLRWAAIALLAGITEEITWRGVQFALLFRLTHNPLLAAILSAASFSISHVIQGWRGALAVVPFALSFQLLAWLAGSLYVAMAVHFLYDLAAGLSYGRLGRELGYEPATQA